MVLAGAPVDPIGWVEPIFTVACGSGLGPPCWRGVVAFPTGPGPAPAGAFASGMVFAPTGDAPEGAAATGAAGSSESGPLGAAGAAAGGAVSTGLVGPSGSGPLERGIVFAPVGAAGGTGAPDVAGGAGGAGAAGGAGGAGAAGAAGGAGDALGAGDGGAVVGASDGSGAVEPFGVTGPESSAGARKLIRTVSFFSGTVEVLTDGF